MNKYTLTILVLIKIFTGFCALADEGGHVGGGDFCAIKIDEIRSDLYGWISRDEYRGVKPADALKLEGTWSLDSYRSEMLSVLISKAEIKPDMRTSDLPVIISCIHETPENHYSPVTIKDPNGADIPVTCKNYDDQLGRLHIDCDFELFMSPLVSSSERYRLIHHEYASLVGIEKKNVEFSSGDPISDYFVSNQVVEFGGVQSKWLLGAERHAGISQKCPNFSDKWYATNIRSGGLNDIWTVKQTRCESINIGIGLHPVVQLNGIYHKVSVSNYFNEDGFIFIRAYFDFNTQEIIKDNYFRNKEGIISHYMMTRYTLTESFDLDKNLSVVQFRLKDGKMVPSFAISYNNSWPETKTKVDGIWWLTDIKCLSGAPIGDGAETLIKNTGPMNLENTIYSYDVKNENCTISFDGNYSLNGDLFVTTNNHINYGDNCGTDSNMHGLIPDVSKKIILENGAMQFFTKEEEDDSTALCQYGDIRVMTYKKRSLGN